VDRAAAGAAGVRLTVVIPTLDEEREIAPCLASVGGQGPLREVVVVDGGSRDRTVASLPEGVRVVTTLPGRARQLNAGAAESRGEALLFLHADCRLPAGALQAVVLALTDPQVVGGAFHKRWLSRSPLLRVAGRLRSAAWFRLGALFGDQAMFVRRAAFEQAGGFDERAEAEDLDLAIRLRRLGRLVLLSPRVEVSARRLTEAGILKTWARWWRAGLRQGVRSHRAARRGARGSLAGGARSPEDRGTAGG
jgi:rSAM/selenodomain-associated transferase 2